MIKYCIYSLFSYLCGASGLGLATGTRPVIMKTQQILLMNTLCTNFLILVSALLLTGCNDGIFVSDVPSPSESQLDIPDGGEAMFTFPTKYLDHISVILPETGRADAFTPDWMWDELDEPYPIYTVYDHNFTGEWFDDAGAVDSENWGDGYYASFYDVRGGTPENVRRMTLKNALTEFELAWVGPGQIAVKAIKNLTGHTIEGSISLGYSFKSESVGFRLAPSLKADDRYEVTGIRYDEDEKIRSLYVKDSISVDFDNQRADTVVYRFPIADLCRVYVDYSINPDLKVRFDENAGFPDVEIPTFRYHPEGGWIRGQLWGEKVPFSFGEQVSVPAFDSALWYEGTFDRAYVITLPPHTCFRGVFIVERLDIATIANLRIRNRADGREMEIPVKVRVNQPHDFRMEYDKFSLDEKI